MAKIKSQIHKKSHVKHKPKGVSKRAFEKVYWPYLPLVLVIGLLLFFSGPGQVWQAASRHTFGKVLDYATSMSVNQLLVATNTQRAAGGVKNLSLNDKLTAAAQAKANDMATRNYWSHYTPEGNAPWVFVTNQSYSYQKLGENLAAGFDDEQSTIDGWMASPSHRENLLDSAFTEVGFGFANIADYTAAGGGPMTVVVAFYGQPVVAAQPIASAQVRALPERNLAETQTSNTEVKSESEVARPNSTQPVNNQTLSPSAKTRPVKTSNAQLVSSNLPYSGYATGVAALILIGAIAVWASRHLFAIRKMLLNGEKFAIKHPLFDIGLMVVAAICYLLTQTAGFIQ